MKDLLSPKQVARAIGVSESSLKRWCDQGLIPIERTVGGHRKVSRANAIRFIRQKGYQLIEPEILDLPACIGRTEWTVERAAKQYQGALIAGREDVCRQVVLDLYLAGHSLPKICDDVVGKALHEVGDLWECGDVQVYEERRGCEICSRVIHDMRDLAGTPSRSAPTALGGTLDGDPYTISAGMAELVLRASGWNAQSLGNRLPFDTLHCAVERHKPRMLWLSISVIRDEEPFCDEMKSLCELCLKTGTAFVIGGAALTPEIRKQICFSSCCDTYEHLSTIAATLLQEDKSIEAHADED